MIPVVVGVRSLFLVVGEPLMIMILESCMSRLFWISLPTKERSIRARRET